MDYLAYTFVKPGLFTLRPVAIYGMDMRGFVPQSPDQFRWNDKKREGNGLLIFQLFKPHLSFPYFFCHSRKSAIKERKSRLQVANAFVLPNQLACLCHQPNCPYFELINRPSPLHTFDTAHHDFLFIILPYLHVL